MTKSLPNRAINLKNLQNSYPRRKRTGYYGILPLRIQIFLNAQNPRSKLRGIQIRIKFRLLKFHLEEEPANNGRILGCESKNHTECKGELWTCERCGKRICWEEGSTDLIEICDDCWVDVRIDGATWHESAD